uniref:Uncharacterized protein n=1 Tax=Cacopsylla melanoneura TaxID=428564 RepID=A0A8D8QUI4_9HEMI
MSPMPLRHEKDPCPTEPAMPFLSYPLNVDPQSQSLHHPPLKTSSLLKNLTTKPSWTVNLRVSNTQTSLPLTAALTKPVKTPPTTPNPTRTTPLLPPNQEYLRLQPPPPQLPPKHRNSIPSCPQPVAQRPRTRKHQTVALQTVLAFQTALQPAAALQTLQNVRVVLATAPSPPTVWKMQGIHTAHLAVIVETLS